MMCENHTTAQGLLHHTLHSNSTILSVSGRSTSIRIRDRREASNHLLQWPEYSKGQSWSKGQSIMTKSTIMGEC